MSNMMIDMMAVFLFVMSLLTMITVMTATKIATDGDGLLAFGAVRVNENETRGVKV